MTIPTGSLMVASSMRFRYQSSNTEDFKIANISLRSGIIFGVRYMKHRVV